MDNNEEKAVLSLIKYFNDEHWIIFDVGANKGTWSDILINYRDSSTQAGKYEVHMFDINPMLLTYLKVKYDYNQNITYCDRGCYKESHKELLADVFEDYHSGLSGIYSNPKWNELEKNKRTVKTITLDDYAESVHWMYRENYIVLDRVGFLSSIEQIDIVKIDVEGADLDVLYGSEQLLRQHKIRFIQIEYSEHWKLGDHTFIKMLDFLSPFGYKAWKFDGQYFVQVERESFIEDYNAQNYILSYLEIGRYHYTQLWNNEFKKNTEFLKGTVRLAIEIGCFEGLTSNYICDHLLNKNWEHGVARLICIDPLTDEYLPDADKVTNDMFVGQYDRFIRNTKDQGIELIRDKSTNEEVWGYLKQYKPDFIYIDGDHHKAAVLQDGIYSFDLLRAGGYLLFDDYDWSQETADGIEEFLAIKGDSLEILVKDYQVLVRKK